MKVKIKDSYFKIVTKAVDHFIGRTVTMGTRTDSLFTKQIIGRKIMQVKMSYSSRNSLSLTSKFLLTPNISETSFYLS
jgi:hypothetical protein